MALFLTREKHNVDRHCDKGAGHECQWWSQLSFERAKFILFLIGLRELEMGVSKREAAENRHAILEASEKLFRAHGIDGVGLSALMKAAGFTQGGFYNHFPSKEALAAEVVGSAMSKANEELQGAIAAPLKRGQTRLGRQLDFYLSAAHCEDIEQGCAIAGLASEVRRLGSDAQGHFAKGIDEMFDTVAALLAEQRPELDKKSAREHAISFYCGMMGALILSRAVREADPALSKAILTAERKGLLARAAADE
jgi:TetR/AcrR family transcriptional repressor of nem operon